MMDKVPCAFCGLPVRVVKRLPAEPVYCCSGCALAAQIPLGGGDLPISRQLVVALSLGFAFFNQFLFWSLAIALRAEGRAVVAGRFDLVALAVGTLVLVAALTLFAGARVRRATDWLGLLLSLLLASIGGFMVIRNGVAAGVAWVVGANAFLLGFLGRGWLKRRWRRGPREE